MHSAPGAEIEVPSGEDGESSLKAGITLRLARGSGALLEGDTAGGLRVFALPQDRLLSALRKYNALK